MPTTSLLIIDPNKLFREGLRRVIDGEAFRIVSDVAGLQEALVLPAWLKDVDLVIFDCTSAGSALDEALRELRIAFPNARLVILTSVVDAKDLGVALDNGVDGFLAKDLSVVGLMQSLRLVMMGEKILPTQLATLLISGRFPGFPLIEKGLEQGMSRREAQILRHLLRGDANKVIANQLGITEATVKVHLKSVLRKIGAGNRTQAAIWALNNGFTDQRDENGWWQARTG